MPPYTQPVAVIADICPVKVIFLSFVRHLDSHLMSKVGIDSFVQQIFMKHFAHASTVLQAAASNTRWFSLAWFLESK